MPDVQKGIKLDVFLRIRHVPNLILRNIVWKVSIENVQTPITERCVSESLGCHNREVLMAARDKYDVFIDLTERFRQDEKEEHRSGKIAALFGESVFRNGGLLEDDGLQDGNFDVNLATTRKKTYTES